MVRLPIDEAERISLTVLKAHGFGDEDARVVTDHLIDAHLTGYTFAGLPRLLVVLDRIRAAGQPPQTPEVVHETPTSVVIDGRGTVGYVSCLRAADHAVRKARESGTASVAVFNSYYSGRSGYYTERIAREDLVAIHMSSASPMVAPTGGVRRVLGSNPLSIAFPSNSGPVVCDMSTAAITWGELQLASRTGEQIPPGRAVNADGAPTVDPDAALSGAILPWGGHKGYALSLAVQALGLLARGDAIPGEYGNFGFLFVAIDPNTLTNVEVFKEGVGDLLDSVKASADDGGVRIPGEGSRQRREKALGEGHIDVPDAVHAALTAHARG